MKTNDFLLILLVILIVLYCYKNHSIMIDTFNNTFGKQKINKVKSPCGLYPELLGQVLEERNIIHTESNYDLYIPCTYNTCEKDAQSFENVRTQKKLFLIDGCDFIASKLDLWSLLKDEFGSDATKYMPQTFLIDKFSNPANKKLEESEELSEFKKHFERNLLKRKDQMYVLKNFAQRQEGIKLTRDKNEIINGLEKGWYLVQDYLYDPFLIAKRKINFRYYLLIVCYQNKISAWVHQNGFVYYTPEDYDEYDINNKKHITTGYIDRKVYETNPLTHDDFRTYLEKNNYSSKKWDSNVMELMKNIMKAISKKVCKNPKLYHQYKFQLFGCDLAPNSKLEPKLMEINKGPDMGAKDVRDREVKLNVQKDIFKIIDPTNPNEKTRFDKINF